MPPMPIPTAAVRLFKMEYTVCGGMVELKGKQPRVEGDGPADKYVKSILEQCQWWGFGNVLLQLDETGHIKTVSG